MCVLLLLYFDTEIFQPARPRQPKSGSQIKLRRNTQRAHRTIIPVHRPGLNNTHDPASVPSSEGWSNKNGTGVTPGRGGLEPVSDATVSTMQYCPLRTLLHMQSCPGLCKNRPVDMYMTFFMCARKRACIYWTYTYVHHEYSRIFMIALPNGRTFPMSFMTCT